MNAPRFTRRRTVIVGAVAAVAAAASLPMASAFADDDASSAAPSDYKLTELPTPDEFAGSNVYDVDPTGTYIVGSGYNGNFDKPLFWHDGEVEQVDVPGVAGRLTGVNSSGLAVGSYQEEDGVAHAFVYEDGEVTELEGPESIAATGVNEHGDITGESADAEESPALVWRGRDAEPERLDLPDGWNQAFTAGINDDGAVAGYYTGGEQGLGYPLMWDADNALVELEIPADVDPEATIRVDAINGDWIVGHIAETTKDGGTLRWRVSDGGPGERLSAESVWEDVSLDGWAVGRSDEDVPVVLADGELVKLPTLVDETDVLNYATAVSDDGLVVGGSVLNKDDEGRAVVWT
ncbi:MAG: hypothetical protein ACRDXX_05130, partial [Stackebrandtia sp.]